MKIERKIATKRSVEVQKIVNALRSVYSEIIGNVKRFRNGGSNI